MSAPAFTPGPWEDSNLGIWAKSPWNARVKIADITVFAQANGIDSAANARLIAAAPDMLAALKSAEIASMELCIDQHPDNQCWVTLAEIRAAIAKAVAP